MKVSGRVWMIIYCSANKSNSTLTIFQLATLSLGQAPGLEAAAAAHDVPGGVREELDADRIRGAARPCSLPSPGSRAPSETVVQISQFAATQTVVIIIIVRRPVKEGCQPVVVVHLLLVVESIGVALGPIVAVQVDLEAALDVAQRVAAALTVRTGLSGDGDVDDPVDPVVDAVVVGAGGGRDGTVLVRLTARLTLESLQVAVLTDLLLAAHLHVADQVSPLTRPLLTALSLLALTVRPAGPIRTILVSATLRVRTQPVQTGAAYRGLTVRVSVALSLTLPASTAVTNLALII